MKLIIFTDGASRGNPGPASLGYVIKNENGLILHQAGEILGVQTNNFAEYSAVLFAFEYIDKHLSKYQTITFYMDSLLVAMQLSGKYKLKSETLRPLFLQIKEIEKKFDLVSYSHVPRKENAVADGLANMALDR